MIARLWHGWTTPENADAYENLLKNEISPGILARNVSGLRKIELLRRPSGGEIEFVCAAQLLRAPQRSVTHAPTAAR